MKLLKPLVLSEAHIQGVQFVPTKAFFKPVLVFSAPADSDIAKLLDASPLYKAISAGVVEGNVKLHGALPGAEVVLRGAHQERIIKSEQVAHFTFFREDKEDRIRLRVHMKEGDGSPSDILDFLAEINKDAFELTVQDAQGSLDGALADQSGKDDPDYKPAEPDGDGFFDEERASKRPFKDGKIEGSIFLLETAEGFRTGWRLVAKLGGSEPVAKGQLLSVDRLAFPSEREALAGAAGEIWLCIPELKAKGPREQKSIAALDAWVTDIDPGLAKAEHALEVVR